MLGCLVNGESSTSAIEPFILTSRVSLLYLAPLQTSHFIHILQEKHRHLKFSVTLAGLAASALYVEAETPRHVSSVSIRKLSVRSLIGVKTPVYVAGFERGVRPIGLDRPGPRSSAIHTRICCQISRTVSVFPVELSLQSLIKYLVQERALARA